MAVPDQTFAPPAHQFGKPTDVPRPGVTQAPAGGQAFALEPDGTIPASLLTGGGGELDYAEITAASTTVAATTEGGATTIITGAALAWDGGTAAIFEFFAPRVTSDGTGLQFVLWDDTNGVSLGLWDNGSSATRAPSLFYRYTPPATATVHSVRAFRTGGTTAGNVISAGAGGAGNRVPAFFRITSA